MGRLLMQVNESNLALWVPTGPAREGDAGIDLINAGSTLIIDPGAIAHVPCGVSVKVPSGHFGMITGRSSTFSKKGLLVPQSIIDEGYVGPLYVVAWNPGLVPIAVPTADRIAQLILVPYVTPVAELVDSLPETERGTHGFGSTG